MCDYVVTSITMHELQSSDLRHIQRDPKKLANFLYAS